METAPHLSRYNKIIKKIGVVVVLDEKFYLSSAKIGAILGVSSRTVQKYKEDGYIGLTEEGVPLIEAVTHYIQHYHSSNVKESEQLLYN